VGFFFLMPLWYHGGNGGKCDMWISQLVDFAWHDSIEVLPANTFEMEDFAKEDRKDELWTGPHATDTNISLKWVVLACVGGAAIIWAVVSFTGTHPSDVIIR
jgi:hypothetical protein